MNFIGRIILTILISTNMCAYAVGKDPIGWSQSGSIPATSQINHSYAINFTIINNLPITMPTPLYISNNSSPKAEVAMVDACSGLKLAPQATCQVGLVLTPKSAGKKKLSVYMEYGKNKIQIPITPLSSTTASGPTSQLEGIVTNGFPTAILSNTTYTLSYQFINNSSSTMNNLVLTQQPDNSAGYAQTFTNCSASLTSGASCLVSGTFTTAATSGRINVGYTLKSAVVSASPISSTIINNATPTAVRTVTFTNKCSSTVWFGLVGGSVNNNPCTSNSDCATGSSCNAAANNGAGACFYNNPVPADNNYALTTNSSNTVQIADYNLQYVWSGNMAARTGATCASGTCDTGDCGSGGGDNACPVGRGFDQPATLAEITMLRSSIDSYDVSILNGTNVGIEMTPTTTGTFNPNGISPAAYNCQSPGKVAAVPGLGLGGCDWASGFTPPAYPTVNSASSYVYVKAPVSPTTCTSDADCSGPNPTCGLSFNKTNSTLNKVCGTLLGYNTANQVCSFANTNQSVPNTGNNPGDAYFSCDTAISGGTGDLAGYTNWAMYACKAQANGDLGSCYNTSANPPASTANCCGCVDWQNVGGVTVPATTIACVNFNSSWTDLVAPLTGYVLPGLKWLKTACPTAYVYPFDDKSSGFACNDINANHPVNTVNYTITFCPT